MINQAWEAARQAACEAAAVAWGEIARLYETGSHVEHTKEGPSTEADKLADRIISRELQRDYPAGRWGYLTEETEDDRQRLNYEQVWIIDPIDGTKDFIKKNGNFAMHIGLVERTANGEWMAVAGAVYRPIPGLMFSAVKGAGSQAQEYKGNVPAGEGRRMRVSSREPISAMKAVISNSHRTPELNLLIERMQFAGVLSIGSIGIKLALIASGDYDVYINLARGKCREWDICAPDLILSEAGGILTGLDGSPISYNKEDVYDRRGLLASNGTMHDELQRAVERIEEEIPQKL